jgi:hypothetical protein
MPWDLTSDIGVFVAAADDDLRGDPVRNTVPLSVLAGLSGRPTATTRPSSAGTSLVAAPTAPCCAPRRTRCWWRACRPGRPASCSGS